MSLLNGTLLVGLVLAALPVLLHLMMRAKPKRIEFPALMLLKTRQTANSRRMRLRHLLLLILRGLLVALAVLALARPSLPAARYGLLWYEWTLLIAVIAATVGVYFWRNRTLAGAGQPEHVLRERRGRLKVFSVLGGLLAAFGLVGLPWGMRVRAEATGTHNPLAENIPVAAVFVFDNSLSMTYKQAGQTRLEQAVELASQQLSVLPSSSRVAVATTEADSESVFQADLAGVKSRMEDLKPYAVTSNLNAAIKSAIQAQLTDREQVQSELSGQDTFAREIYVLTDGSEAAWREPDESGLKDLLTQYDWLRVYLIDVGVDQPRNIALQQLKLDREATVDGQPIRVSVAVAATESVTEPALVEVVMINQRGDEVTAGLQGSPRQRVEFGGSPEVKTFVVGGTTPGESQRGMIRMTTADPMSFDDVRYFEFGVREIPRVLIVGDRPVDSRILRFALQPPNAERQGFSKRYEVKAITSSRFSREKLNAYDVVCLANWVNPPQSAWVEIQAFVKQGGGLFVVTGGEKMVEPAAYSSDVAIDLLPGVPLIAQTFRDQPPQLTLSNEGHPICRPFAEEDAAAARLSQAFFERFWSYEVAEEAVTVMTFNDPDRSPALLERSIGAGKVLMFASGIDNNGLNNWNENFVNNSPWTFLIFCDVAMNHLIGTTDVKQNFSVGEAIEVRVPAAKRFQRYRVARPRFRVTDGEFAFDEPSVLLDDIDEAGHYRLNSADEDVAFAYSFAANDFDAESNLTRITDDRLTEIFGPDRFSRVRNTDELDRAVDLGRLGVEIFPVLIGLVIALFCAEHLMANFFYDEDPTASSA